MPQTASKTAAPSNSSYSFTVSTPEYRSQPIPGVVGTPKVGDCFVKVGDLPNKLGDFMEVNPRVPSRTKRGVLSGPVIKGILQTLRENPDDMALKNQGIYLLADNADFKKGSGGVGELTVRFSDRTRHGIVNGGHTFAAIREALENSDENELDLVERAFVRLHILQGIDAAKVPEIAEGLNRSKQVDDPSLDNLRELFDGIKKAMEGHKGAEAIAYHQGDDGELYVPDVLVFLQLLNRERYTDSRHPHSLYQKPKMAIEYFKADMAKEEAGKPTGSGLLVARVSEVLKLYDTVRYKTPGVAKSVGFEFGRLKTGAKKRAGNPKHRNTPLPFIGTTMDHRVPRGWVMPMLAAFRANLNMDAATGKFEWRIPINDLVDEIMPELVGICVTEHRDNNVMPKMVGSRESSYRQCYDKVLLHLAKKRKLYSEAE